MEVEEGRFTMGPVCGKISRAFYKVCKTFSRDVNNLTDRREKIEKKMIEEQKCSVFIIPVMDENEEEVRKEIQEKLKQDQETLAMHQTLVYEVK